MEKEPEVSKKMVQAVIDQLRGGIDEIRVILRKERPKKYKIAVLQLEKLCEDCSEMDIIKAVAEGLSNKEIANKLFITEGTVKNYITSILAKENLSHRTALAVYYLTGNRDRYVGEILQKCLSILIFLHYIGVIMITSC